MKDALIAVHFQCQGQKAFKTSLSKSPRPGIPGPEQSNNGQTDVFEPLTPGGKSALMFRISGLTILEIRPSKGPGMPGFFKKWMLALGLKKSAPVSRSPQDRRSGSRRWSENPRLKKEPRRKKERRKKTRRK
jgi:hypothetical protein